MKRWFFSPLVVAAVMLPGDAAFTQYAPPSGKAIVAQGGGRLANTTGAVDEGGAVAEARARYKELENAARQTARAYQQSLSKSRPDHPDVYNLRAELRRAVASAFAARQQLQRAELEELRGRLEQVEQLVDSRERSKEEIIDRRVGELLNPELEWEPQGELANQENDSVESESSRRADQITSSDSPLTRSRSGAPPATADGSALILRSAEEFSNKLLSAQQNLQLVQQMAEKGLELADSVEAGRQQLAIVRAELAAQIRLLELELADAELAAASTAEDLDWAKQLAAGGIAPQADVNPAARAASAAKTRVERARTLLELYKQIDAIESRSSSSAAIEGEAKNEWQRLVELETAAESRQGAERTDLLREAAAGYEQFYNQHRTQAAGLYARLHQVRCLRALGQQAQADSIVAELLQHFEEGEALYKLQATAGEELSPEGSSK